MASTYFYLKSASSSSANHGPATGTSSRLARLNRKDATEEVLLDFNQDSKGVVGEILKNISRKEGITKGRRLAYLNVFVKYLQHLQTTTVSEERNLGFTVEEICLCLRTCLVHEATVIRIAALRVLRYLVVDEEDLIAVSSTGIPFLVVRSLDVVLNNSGERMQAARFCQRILSIHNGAQNFPSPMTRALIAIGFDGLIEHDKLHRGSLSILCQLAILNPMHFIESGGVRVLLHNVLGCTTPMVLEAILGSLLHLLNVPETRDAAGVNLHALVGPISDLHFKLSGHEYLDKDMDEREIGYRCAKVAIATVLRSWSGIAHFCQNHNSGLQALIDALYIEQLEIRTTVMDLICEIIGLTFPTWTDEVTVALSAVDPCYPKDSWRLQEGFVVEEALVILPHLASHTPNITANHKALLVYCFARRGLLDALVEVIVTSDTFISVRATVLLGELLSLIDHFLPVECFDPSQCIPSLIRHTMPDSNPPIQSSNSRFCSAASVQLKQHRAMEAVSVLSALQKIKSKPLTPNSVFLQAQLSFAGFTSRHQDKFMDRLGQVQLTRVLRKEIESSPSKILKETGVVTSKDPLSWQWELICTLVKWAPTSLKRVDDSSWRTFLRRLVDFFKPSNNIFARMELGKGQSKLFAKTGCFLLQFLADEAENFSGQQLLEELLADIAMHLDELLRHKQNPYVCFLSPNRLETTMSQTYFLFVGKLSQSSKGLKILERQDILKRFLDLVKEMQHECYVKLIVSSLYYGEEYCRRILTAALLSKADGARLYSTQFLRVLVRAKLPDLSKWGIELLVNQLSDKNRAISLTALDILEEAIHDKLFLESLIALRPTLTHLGDRGLLLLICFLSLPSGYKFLMEANFLRSEIEKWHRHFNKRYVELVEVLVRDSVSTLRRGEDGKYPERASRNQEQSKFVDIFVPPHLYGQLAQHKPGLELLIEVGYLDDLMKTVNAKKCSGREETRELKAALWALGHLGTSVDALQIIDDGDVLHTMVILAQSCPVLSVRHTTFHCLCLICCTQPGAETLRKYNWHAMPRNHHETYPIWGSLAFPEKFSKPRTLFPELDADLELDLLEKASINSKADTCSNILMEEDVESIRCFMFDEQLNNLPFDSTMNSQFGSGGGDGGSLQLVGQETTPRDLIYTTTAGTAMNDSGETSGTRKISHVHHRSQSDSQTLTTVNSNASVNEGDDVVDGGPVMNNNKSSSGFFGGGSLRGRVSSFLSGGSGGGANHNHNTGTSSFGSGGVGGNHRISTMGSNNGSWRWRKSRSDSVTESSTSGISSCDSSSAGARSAPPQTSDHVQTLSPIPSSASIATTILSNPPSLSNLSPPSNSRDTSRALTDPGTRLGSPSYIYRSMIRKPVFRMPMLSDPDIYPPHSHHHHRRAGSIREMKAGSLDRHFMLSPRDLFNESKLMRVNSSLTSLSTPSFRTRPQTCGPCYMGLCLPKDFNMIFLSGGDATSQQNGHDKEPLETATAMGWKFGVDPEPEVPQVDINLSSNNNHHHHHNDHNTDDAFEFHTPSSCLGCMRLREVINLNINIGDDALKSMENLQVSLGTDTNRNSMVSIGSVLSGSSLESKSDKRRIIPDSPHGKNILRKEIIRLVSSMISCVGAKSHEQGLLRLKQRFPKAFHDLCLYSELCVLLSCYNVRLPLRRFVQELFLDLPFEEFYTVAANIFQQEQEMSASASATTTDTSETSTVIEIPLGNTGLQEDTIAEVDDTTPSGPSPDSDYIDLR